MEEENIKPLIFLIIIVNCVLGLADRITQLCYYCITRNDFIKETSIKNTALVFCILPTAIHVFMILIYVLFHHEQLHTCKHKAKIVALYTLSTEALFPIGMHRSFKSKYSETADNVLITMKVLNAVHCMFVSLPQLLIVTVNSSASDKGFSSVGIASLVFSVVFMVWSVGYYFICAKKEDDIESVLEVYVK